MERETATTIEAYEAGRQAGIEAAIRALESPYVRDFTGRYYNRELRILRGHFGLDDEKSTAPAAPLTRQRLSGREYYGKKADIQCRRCGVPIVKGGWAQMPIFYQSGTDRQTATCRACVESNKQGS